MWTAIKTIANTTGTVTIDAKSASGTVTIDAKSVANTTGTAPSRAPRRRR